MEKDEEGMFRALDAFDHLALRLLRSQRLPFQDVCESRFHQPTTHAAHGAHVTQHIDRTAPGLNFPMSLSCVPETNLSNLLASETEQAGTRSQASASSERFAMEYIGLLDIPCDLQ